ncbi:MAG: hypothetical protein RLZZ568_1780, partial [Cyanobacteriota bacterium]
TFSGVLLTLATFGATSAHADSVLDKGSILFSQLAGHDVYQGTEQMSFDGLAIGRVRGAVGSILQVELVEYGDFPGYIEVNDDRRLDHWNGQGSAKPGDDVLLRPRFDDDGQYLGAVFVDVAHPAWLTRLDLKQVETVQISAIDLSSVEPVSLPPAPRPTSQPTQTPAPIRGLW